MRSDTRKKGDWIEQRNIEWNNQDLGVNFIIALRAAFVPVDPKSVKRYWQLDWILTLLGATGIKAVCKYVGEIETKSWQIVQYKGKEKRRTVFKVIRSTNVMIQR